MRARRLGTAMRGLLLSLALLLAGPPALAQSPDWALLGPLGPIRVNAIGVSPGWPGDGLILAAGPGRVVRSTDGGMTWAATPTPAETIEEIIVAPPVAGIPLVYAVAGRPGQLKSLYRSTDGGMSWSEVLPPTGNELTLELSPAFADDAVALVVVDGRLLRTRDGGVTWDYLETVPGQQVQVVRLSPSFREDRTIFAGVVSGGFPSVTGDRPGDQPSDDHERSAGVVMSTDGGDTWTPVSAGLAVDEVPYRHVQELVVSPSFAQDGTLFAYAWGPRVPTPFQQAMIRRGTSALFRSRDRGASWERIAGWNFTATVGLAPSPSYAEDGIVLMSRGSSFVSPASSTCAVERSTDGGVTWTQVVRPGSYEGCRGLQLVGGGDSLTGLVYKGQGWLRSDDAGQTWRGFGPPGPGSGMPVNAVAPSPAIASDRAVFVGSSAGGVWVFGPGARGTDGRLACAAEAVGGFGRIIAAEIVVRAWLGCAVEPERAVQVHESRVGVGRALWIDDEPGWFEVIDSPPDRWGDWRPRTKAQSPPPSDGGPLIDGAIQRFDGGTLLFLARPDGRRSILVLIGSGSGEGRWREVPD